MSPADRRLGPGTTRRAGGFCRQVLPPDVPLLKSFSEANYPAFDICKEAMGRQFELIITD